MANKAKAHYFATKKEVKIMSICLKYGYQVYPHIDNYSKHWPLVRLAYQYRYERPVLSKKEPFVQKYLGYEIHQLYKLLYEKKVKPEIERQNNIVQAPKKIIRFPPPPPKRMAPPPPPPPPPNL
jgi:hypothetical protein